MPHVIRQSVEPLSIIPRILEPFGRAALVLPTDDRGFSSFTRSHVAFKYRSRFCRIHFAPPPSIPPEFCLVKNPLGNRERPSSHEQIQKATALDGEGFSGALEDSVHKDSEPIGVSSGFMRALVKRGLNALVTVHA